MFRRTTVAAVIGVGVSLTLAASGMSSASAGTSTALATGSSIGTTTGNSESSSSRELGKITKLKDNKTELRAAPGPGGHMYSYQTSTNYWSVVAVNPAYYLDVDLRVYGDKGEDELLGQSLGAAGSIDFVAVDSNHRPLDTYFARVDKVEGAGKYFAELAQGTKVVTNGYQNVPMPGSQFVTVFDTLLVAGTNYRFVLAPTSKSMNGAMYLMASDPSIGGTWVQSKAQSVRQGDAPTGEASVFDFTPSRTDRYGLVVTSRGDAGTFGLTRITY